MHWLKLQESSIKASIICPESEIIALGDWDGSTPEQLTAQVKRLEQRFEQERQRYSHDRLSSLHFWDNSQASA